MAGQAGKWRYGLLPLVALWLGVNTLETPRIEADLGDRAQRALDALGAAGVHPRVEGRDVTLRGEVADPAARAAALAGVAAAAGARATVDALSAAPASGQAPDVAAAPPETPDSAKTKPARPRPPAAAAESPPVAKPAAPSGVEKAASGDSKDATADPVAAPYLFQVEKAGGKVALSGFYPDADAHSRIVAVTAGAFYGRELLDQLKPAGGAPHGFLDAALAGLGQLARLRSGALTLHDRAVRLSGEAASADVADDIRARLIGALPGDFSVNAQITGPARDSELVRAAPRVEPTVAQPVVSPSRRAPVKPAPLDARACQARLAALVEGDPIVFTLGSARIEPGSAQMLDALASEAKRCPDVDFEVAGHTDDIGIVSENLRAFQAARGVGSRLSRGCWRCAAAAYGGGLW